jgi:hypothetical protein
VAVFILDIKYIWEYVPKYEQLCQNNIKQHIPETAATANAAA